MTATFELHGEYPLLSLGPQTLEGTFLVTIRDTKSIVVVELGSGRGERRLKLFAADYSEYAYPYPGIDAFIAAHTRSRQ